MTICPLPSTEAEFCIWPMPMPVQEYDVRYKGRAPKLLKNGKRSGELVHAVLAAFEDRPASVHTLSFRTGQTSAQVRSALKNLRLTKRVRIVMQGRGSASGVYAPVGDGSNE